MHKITFFPLGNADCCRIDTSNGRIFLFDYANRRDPKDKQDKRIDLFAELKKDLQAAKRDSYDVVAFTHLDDDQSAALLTFSSLSTPKSISPRIAKDRSDVGTRGGDRRKQARRRCWHRAGRGPLSAEEQERHTGLFAPRCAQGMDD